MKHRPRKRFGQNFLQSAPIIEDILRAFHPKASDQVVEIGPGLGALTKPLLHTLDSLTAIEIDKDLYAHLEAMFPHHSKLKLINKDALTVDYRQFGEHLRIIGNLPYNISTPFILHLLGFVEHIEDMHFMLQKEVADRIAATPGSKTYGRLSVMVQYYCEVEQLFIVPASAFYPEPKVESAILRMSPYQASPYPHVDFSTLEKVVATAFSMRRKTLANTMKPLLNAAALLSLGIDPSLRPEQISVNNYVQIAKFVTN